MMFTIQSLGQDTWEDFAILVESNTGVWGGCWCTWYHGGCPPGRPTENRLVKADLVKAGTARAALVYDGDRCVGWCQYGTPAELPRIHNQRAYEALKLKPADWRITCLFVRKEHRGKGVAEAGLQGAIAQIDALGGGRVEGFPDETGGARLANAFLFNGLLSTFERQGFTRVGRIGKRKWVVALDVLA